MWDRENIFKKTPWYILSKLAAQQSANWICNSEARPWNVDLEVRMVTLEEFAVANFHLIPTIAQANLSPKSDLISLKTFSHT